MERPAAAQKLLKRASSAKSAILNLSTKSGEKVSIVAASLAQSLRQTNACVELSRSNARVGNALDCPSWALPAGIRNHAASSLDARAASVVFQDLPPAQPLVRWLKSAGRGSTGIRGILGVGSQPDFFDKASFVAFLEGLPSQTSLLVIFDSDDSVRWVRRHVAADQVRRLTFVRDRSPQLRAALLCLADYCLLPARSSVADKLESLDANSFNAQSRLNCVPVFHDLTDPILLAEDREKLRFKGRRLRLRLLEDSGLDQGFAPLNETAESVEQFLASTRAATSVKQPQKIVVAGHDFKFAQNILRELNSMSVAVEIDEWSGHGRHDEKRSKDLAAWADAVFCEWALGNVAWYTKNTPSTVRVTARFHMQERDAPFLNRIKYERLAGMIFVADHARQQVLRDFPLDPRRTILIPNTVETHEVPLLEGERDLKNVAFVGMVPHNKRIDLAYDTLEALRRLDSDYRLDVRGKLPADFDWMESRPVECNYYEQQGLRQRSSDALKESVHFEPYGDGLFEWYRLHGAVISTSSFEAFHYSLPEGAIQGAVPRSLAWPGADLMYPLSWLAPDPDSLAEIIHASTHSQESWASNSKTAREFVISRFDAAVVSKLVTQIITGTVGDEGVLTGN